MPPCVLDHPLFGAPGLGHVVGDAWDAVAEQLSLGEHQVATEQQCGVTGAQ
jgi:hypothetical protein